MCLHVQSPKLVHLSGVHCQVHVSSISCFAFVYFTELYRVGFPCGSPGKESACNAGDLGLIPGLGRSPGEGKGNPLHYSGLENCMDWTVHGITKSRTQLRYFH